MDENKPPLGAKPYFVAIPQRIQELTEAIERQMEEYPVLNEKSCELIGIWSAEIAYLCDVCEKLRNFREDET